MAAQTDSLVMDILRKIQSDLADVKTRGQDLATGLTGIREQLHVMEGNALRMERTVATVLVRLDRIEKRLELVDH
jgi:hypothetical protein